MRPNTLCVMLLKKLMQEVPSQATGYIKTILTIPLLDSLLVSIVSVYTTSAVVRSVLGQKKPIR